MRSPSERHMYLSARLCLCDFDMTVVGNRTVVQFDHGKATTLKIVRSKP